MNQATRTEEEVFEDLAALCSRPGYIHALAALSFRDNVILYNGNMKEEDLSRLSSPERLNRLEFNTLIGLMIKAEIDWSLPTPKVLQGYLDDTDRLLIELHECLSRELFSGLSKEKIKTGSINPFERGKALREPIFYGGESAYNFQYLDLSIRKYAADAPWLYKNLGFNIDEATRIAKTIDELYEEKLEAVRELMRG